MAAVLYAPRRVEMVHERAAPMTREYDVRRHEQPWAGYVGHINTHIVNHIIVRAVSGKYYVLCTTPGCRKLGQF